MQTLKTFGREFTDNKDYATNRDAWKQEIEERETRPRVGEALRMLVPEEASPRVVKLPPEGVWPLAVSHRVEPQLRRPLVARSPIAVGGDLGE